MKNFIITKITVLSIIFSCLFGGSVFAQGYSGLNKEKEEANLSEINEMTKKIHEYEKKVALLERQKSIIEEKFYELQDQRDTYYRLTLVKSIETKMLHEKLEYLEYVFRSKLDEKDLLRRKERIYFNQTKDDWLFDMYEGKELSYNPALLKTKTRKELTDVKKELKETVNYASRYEGEMSKLSNEYNNYKTSMLKKVSLDERFIDALEDNLDSKKGRINDLKDDLVTKEMDLIRIK